MNEEAMDFIEAMVAKAVRKSVEHGRPMDPWNHHSGEFFSRRMMEELEELMEADVADDREGVMEELIDVANFAMFRWIQLRNLGVGDE